MTEKEIRKRNHNRYMIDMIVNRIKKVDSYILDYSNYMDEKDFAESNEVQSLYDELRMLGLELYHEKISE